MNIFCDLHHEDLYYSLYLLFEKRLGFNLFHPIELDWFDEKFWNLGDPYPNPRDTACQYLNEKCKTWGNRPSLNHDAYIDNNIYYIYDNFHSYYRKAISLKTFKDMKFDIIISSFPAHSFSYEKLKTLYQPQAKHIFQIGNNWTFNYPTKNILTSSKKSNIPNNFNSVYYHQEFDTKIFSYDKSNVNKESVINFQHCMSFPKLFEEYEKEFSNWTWKAYGAGNREDSAPTIKDTQLSKLFQEAGLIWHLKEGGDGYGYNIHYAYATGTPMIINSFFQRGMTAEDLYEDKKNCVDVFNKDKQTIIKQIHNVVDNYDYFSQNAYNRFKEVVNFDEEFIKIRAFLERLI